MIHCVGPRPPSVVAEFRYYRVPDFSNPKTVAPRQNCCDNETSARNDLQGCQLSQSALGSEGLVVSERHDIITHRDTVI